MYEVGLYMLAMPIEVARLRTDLQGKAGAQREAPDAEEGNCEVRGGYFPRN